MSNISSHLLVNSSTRRYNDDMRKTTSGFTIVELLIVIVVIGILAAITIVAYNGIQTRARNAQQITSAKAYLSAFAAYVAANNTYPPSVSRVCLGIDQGACVNNTSWSRDSGLETALKTLVSPLPAANSAIPIVSTPKMGYTPVTGLAGNDLTLDGVQTPFLIYTLEASGTCTTGSPASGTWPNYSSTAPSQGYTSTEGSVRVCMIPLPRI